MDNDIRDIRGPVHIPYPWLWIAYALGVVLALLLLWALWRWYRAQKLAKAKLPHEIALEELEKARALMKTDSVRAYTFAVSEIVRNYIEQRFKVMAARRTTEEFLRDQAASATSPLVAHASLLEQFLKNCDLVKFGKWSLTLPEMEAMHASAVNFIAQTRPSPGELEMEKQNR